MIVTAENREQHFRSNNKFYVAGWVANEQCENPQALPESCKDNPIIVKQYEDYRPYNLAQQKRFKHLLKK